MSKKKDDGPIICKRKEIICGETVTAGSWNSKCEPPIAVAPCGIEGFNAASVMRAAATESLELAQSHYEKVLEVAIKMERRCWESLMVNYHLDRTKNYWMDYKYGIDHPIMRVLEKPIPSDQESGNE